MLMSRPSSDKAMCFCLNISLPRLNSDWLDENIPNLYGHDPLHKMKSISNNFTGGLKALTPPAKTGLIHQCKVGGKGLNTPHKSGSNIPV